MVERSSPKGMATGSSPVTGAEGGSGMIRVEVTLTSNIDDTFEARKIFEYDSDDWWDLTPQERQQMMTQDSVQFLNDTIAWDFKII